LEGLHRGADWLFGIVAILWILAVGCGVAIAGARMVALRRQIALCLTARGILGGTYDAVLAEMGCRGRPARLVVSDSLKSPALIGCWRPVIVLPRWFAEQHNVSQLRWVLKHEVSHLLHRDHWADIVRRVARTMLFFHPIVRWASRRWEEAAEAACDRALVRGEMDVVDYTACLLSIVERVGSERTQMAPLGLFATQTQIQRRIGELLALKPKDFTPLRRRHCWLLLPAASLMLCGFSLATPQEEAANQGSGCPVEPPSPAIAGQVAAVENASVETEGDLDSETAELLAKTIEANRYQLEDVVIGNVKEPVPQATSSAMTTIRNVKLQTAGVVKQYVDANRAWLLPDLKRRSGLVYDYTQEDGYRERIIFDPAGNVLAQLESDRQSDESPSHGQQHLFTADGQEANGVIDEPFLSARRLDPESTSTFSGRKMLNNLATGWHWECASMLLARGADDFGIRVEDRSDGKTRKLTLRPVRNGPALHIGTMLRFISWAYLPRRSFERCEIDIDRKTQLPIRETYFRDGESEPFCTIRFVDWLDTPEGKAPGKVIGRATYRKRGERNPETREYEYFEEVFRFTGRYRVTDGGLLLLDKVDSTFESTGSGSTGRVTLVEPTAKEYQPLKDALKRLAMTSDFLASVEKAPRGLGKVVPCRWGETTPVWFNGKYEHQATGQGDEGREPPYVAYRQNLGIQDLRPELLAAGKMRVTVNVYSTVYYQGYAFDLSLALADGEGRTLVQQTASQTTKTMGRPEQKQIVFEFDAGVDSDSVQSIALTLRINRQWGSHHYRGMWLSHVHRVGDKEIAYLPGGRDWGPEQAIGEPTNRRRGGDYKHAWSPLTEDEQQEWLEVAYRNRINAVGVNVYETLNPGAIHKVTYFDANGKEQVAWQGDDPTLVDTATGCGVSKIRFARGVATDRVRIYLDSPRVKGWNEIDAVGLIEAARGELPEHEYWARDATASSTFAKGPRPETITYRYEGPHTELKYDDGYRDRKRSLTGTAWQVIRFVRPEHTPYLDAARVLGTSDGYRPEKTTFFVLDKDMNVLKELSSGSRIRGRGPVKWYVFHAPSIEVPETFHIAFQFNSPENGGTFVAMRELDEGESGHSFIYDKQQGLEPLVMGNVGYDWMIRAYLAARPNEKARQEEEARRQRDAAEAAVRAKGRSWGPEQATGSPDAYDHPKGADQRSAWASKTKDGQAEWLELTYAKQIKAIGVDVYETFNPGAVNKVTVFPVDGEEEIAWQGDDPTPADIASGKGISKIRFAQPRNTNRIRIHMDSVNVKGWNEIDAVGLVESEASVHWATSATASSTYAR